jgi:creatinine amidohydrolase/Fe(II)-dependent formamide hydrolase-like protein
MRHAGIVFALSVLMSASPAAAQVVQLTDLNTAQISALDRSKTVVLLTGGMLEEHGPYLPAFTDGILSARLSESIARAVMADKPGWTVLQYPQIAVGASGSNEIGTRFSFPGTYAVRPSTLRAVFMDLASELGEQGFRWIMVVHVHGSPLHLRAIDDAGDFFQDTYGGRMVNLWDLVPVISGWGNAMASMTDAEKKEDGRSLHAGMDEHSLMLHLRPELVAPGHRTAPSISPQTLDGAFAVARAAGWPGYIGAPRLATAAFGAQIWNAFAAAAIDQTLKILNGADTATITRYVDLLEKNPVYQKEWIAPARARDEELDAKQREWLRKKGKS